MRLSSRSLRADHRLRRLDHHYRSTDRHAHWIAASLSSFRSIPLPAFLASALFPGTGKGFDVLHYTIARWQDEVTQLKVIVDVLAILRQIGLA
jgi:hypothetical protein